MVNMLTAKSATRLSKSTAVADTIIKLDTVKDRKLLKGKKNSVITPNTGNFKKSK